MTFSEQFKDIFNMLCEKIGIAIDWTQDNIVPYVMELCKRFVILNIVKEALWLVGGIIAVVIVGFLSKKLFKDYRKCASTREGTFWWKEFYGDVSPKTGTAIVFIVGGVVLLFGLIVIPCSISELVKWAVVPEVQLIKEITSFIPVM